MVYLGLHISENVNVGALLRYDDSTNSSDEEHEILGRRGCREYVKQHEAAAAAVEWKHCFHFVPKLICRRQTMMMMTVPWDRVNYFAASGSN